MSYKDIKKAYDEILSIIKKHEHEVCFNYKELENEFKTHLFGIELREKYGLNLDPKKINSLEWNRFGKYISIGYFGKKYNRTIPFPDDGRQPEDELLVEVGFCTGAYIFGDDYPRELFEQFWQELKTYNPNYCDTANHTLYFTLENGAKIFNEFNKTLTEYYELNKEDAKKRKIEKLKSELANLISKEE